MTYTSQEPVPKGSVQPLILCPPAIRAMRTRTAESSVRLIGGTSIRSWGLQGVRQFQSPSRSLAANIAE